MQKILIIRFSSIGDIVLTTPVIRCLKKQLPGVELHFLTRDTFREVLQHNPYIDKLWLAGNSLKAIISDLKKEGFTSVIDLHHNLRSLRIKLELNIPSYSFHKLNIRKWLLVNFKLNTLPAVHIAERYLETVRHLGVINDQQGLDYFTGNNEMTVLSRLPEFFRNGYTAIVIGAKHQTKIFPADKLIRVIKMLNSPVILLGGKEDKLRGDEIKNAVVENCFNASGMFSLDESAMIIKNAAAVLTNDTGLMHIAAAFQKPVISIWGNTVPEFGMTPYLPLSPGNSIIHEVKNLNCRPCSKIGFEKCPRGHFRCMNDHDEKSIAESISRFRD